ncbi:MAG TPA: YCF48-related protein [Terriglobia bacterium]|nr:YCF48-related protein [Terriglobia bacterium]
MDPVDPQKLFVFTKNGQCYYSDNGAASWEFMPLALPQNAELNAAVLDPGNSNTIYIGVSDQFMREASSFEGVYKSVDGGRHWEQLPQTSRWSVFSLAISTDRPLDIAAGTRTGVFRSRDGGKNWTRLSPASHPELKNVVSLALDPLDPEVTYAGTPHLPWRTLDNGKHWTSITEGMIDDSDIFSIAVDRGKVNMVYASACSGIYRSIIRGTRWTKVQGIPGSNRRTHILLQDPTDLNILFAGTTQGLWKSSDRGTTWEKPNPYPYSINSIVVNPLDNNVLYVATDRSGILKSEDGGKTFVGVNQGFVNRNLTRFLTGSRLYTCSVYDGEFGGVFSSEDEGHTWELIADNNALLGKNIISLAVSPTDPSLVVAGTYEGMMKSRDGGINWEFIPGSSFSWGRTSNLPVVSRNKPGSRVHRIPENTLLRNTIRFNDLGFSTAVSGVVYAASSAGLFRSVDYGESWGRVANLGTRDVSRIILHPTDPNWLMIFSDGDLMISANQGRRWTTAAIEVPGIQIYNFAFSLESPGGIWAGTSHGLFHSSDGGRTWTRKKEGLPFVPIHNIYVTPQKPNIVFVQSNGSNQVYRSADGGDTWERFDSRGLEGVSVQAFSPSSGGGADLWLLSENRGVFRYRSQSSVATK